MSIKRKIFGRAGASLAAVLILAPMLAACGGDNATPTKAPTTAPIVAPTNAVTEPTAMAATAVPSAAVMEPTAMVTAMSTPGGTMMEPMTIQMNAQNASGEDGTATIVKSDAGMVVTIDLKNGTTEPQPAHIHKGTCAALGDVAQPLTNVVGGKSASTIPSTFTMEAGQSYAINVHKSAAEVSVYVSCGDITGTTTLTGTPGTTGAKLKVGLVTDTGSVNDKSFNQSSWEGVKRAETELGVETKYVETKDAKDYAANIQQFVDAKYDVIVTVGFNLAADTVAAAKANPGIKFIGVDQFQEAEVPNLAGLIFDEDKAGYLAGALAALLSKTGNIGAVCGTDAVPPVWRFGEAYKVGAMSIKPDIKVQVTYHSDVDFSKTFNDPEWGKTTALSMIDGGADVLFGAGGNTGNGAIFAAKDKGLPAIGVDTDQYFTIGDQYKSALASSAMKLLTPGVFNLIKTVQDGTFKGGNNVGEVGLAPFHDMDSQIPAEAKTKLQEIDKGLKDGTIKTCVSPAKGAPSPCTTP